MDSPAPLDADAFRRLYPWLTDWFRRPNVALFAGAGEKAIAAELGRRWGEVHPIALLDGLREQFGSTVSEVVRIIVHENARRDWEAIAAQQPGNGIEDLIRLLWEPLGRAGFEFAYRNLADEVQFRCTHCPHVAVARELGAEDWMTLLLCGADIGMTAGFNPAIAFRRTQTLMEGHPCCDHCYAQNAARTGAGSTA